MNENQNSCRSDFIKFTLVSLAAKERRMPKPSTGGRQENMKTKNSHSKNIPSKNERPRCAGNHRSVHRRLSKLDADDNARRGSIIKRVYARARVPARARAGEQFRHPAKYKSIIFANNNQRFLHSQAEKSAIDVVPRRRH